MKTMTKLLLALLFLVGAADHTEAKERTGYVMRVEGRLVFIDLGAQDEIIPNDLFRVIRQETIIHPVTGENLGGEVPLGMIKVVEIFPRYSTAEILNMDPGADVRMMEADAKQGLIRVKMLNADEQMDVQNLMTRRPMVRAPTAMVPLMGNPDGEIRSIVPEFRIGGGSAAETNLPDRGWQLVADPSLLTQMDTTAVDQELENFNSSILAEVGVSMPLNDKTSFVGSLGIGAATKLALGGKYFTGSLFGSGIPTPSGRVGEPSFTVTVGYGGRGSSSLPSTSLPQLVAQSTLTATTEFIAGLTDTTLTAAQQDSLFQIAITDSIRSAASDSLKKLSSKGLGFGIGIDLPVTEQFKIDAHIERYGSLEEMAVGVTWYQKRMAMGDTNPDGVLRSLIARARVILDTHTDKTYFDLGVTYPVTKQYTVSAGFLSDFGGFSQFGLAVRGYINRQ